ncbi:hypothetical protein M438DRAFT_345670 [Aureobasidium pullulans EXF-150]|uniref:Uncharacterized protein n=1 Tax=Aureobasidium pullulans EXF-150 TaxID=1043002 RepID=A0A074XLG9_AURPU|nr:uncharacterized protein M438DRAFT_345670 [Aureobasidium pullulans EXF-150]KEQ84549.1 hypothetical protein M438DRAFT_345670 [Aureobasidium pullulans EXF-150]
MARRPFNLVIWLLSKYSGSLASVQPLLGSDTAEQLWGDECDQHPPQLDPQLVKEFVDLLTYAARTALMRNG